jgi:thymidylate synthase
MQIKVNDVRELLAQQYLNERFTTDKSGVQTVELVGVSFIADKALIFGSENAQYIQHELDWYLSQSLNVNDIPGKTPTIWNAVATPDGFINSNYGYLALSKENGSQYENVRNELCINPESRRAVMIYTRPTMHTDWCAGGMSDFICTNAVQFLLRDSQLHMIVQMRSQDAVFGYKNDYAWQKYIQGCMLEDLVCRTGNKIAAGSITWQVGSLHVYSRHFKYIKDYLSQDDILDSIDKAVFN